MLVGFNHKNDSLSDRQLQVLQGRALGVPYEEIAKYLEISPKTVEEHRRRAYAKIRCHTGHEAKTWLMQNGLYAEKEEWEILIKGNSGIEETRKIATKKTTNVLAAAWSKVLEETETVPDATR